MTNSRVSSSKTEPSVEVKCKHCGVVFTAPLKLAVCRKCGRDASRPLAWHWRFLGAVVPLWGVVHALILKSHSPVASRNALWSALVGLFLYGAFFAWQKLV